MAIKASGFRLSQVSADAGWVGVDIVRLNELLGDPALARVPSREAHERSISLIQGASVGSSLRPSLETTFHAWVPGRVVLHSHSVWANLYGCAPQGESWLGEDWASIGSPPPGWVGYETPGLLLGWKVRDACRRAPTPFVLLQNHGWIVSASTVEQAGQLHNVIRPLAESRFGPVEDCNARVEPSPHAVDAAERWQRWLGFHRPAVVVRPARLRALADRGLGCPARGPLVPDDVVCGIHAIPTVTHPGEPAEASRLAASLPSMGALWDEAWGFLLFGPSARAVDAVEQNLAANVTIHRVLGRHGCVPQLLDPPEVSYLASMESETYRQRIASGVSTPKA
jgi:ribulose-5-phosphate 4-epimerase/fuculose-1-phosphate aldolase